MVRMSSNQENHGAQQPHTENNGNQPNPVPMHYNGYQPAAEQPQSSQSYPEQAYGQTTNQQGFATYSQMPYAQQPTQAQQTQPTTNQQWAAGPQTPYGPSYGQAANAPGQQFPPQGPYYPPIANDRWNTLCIVGFILSFFIAPVGLVLSIIALVQINKSHEKSRGMAIAGIVIGAVETILWAIFIAFVGWGISLYMNDGGMMKYYDDSSCTTGDCSDQQSSGESASQTIQYTSHGYRYSVSPERL